MSSSWLDLRFARRNFSKNPGFVATAVAILAVAVGLSSAVFSLVQALVLRPLPVSEPERLVRIYSSQPGDFMSHSQMASADVDDLRDRATSLTAVVSYFYTSLVVEHEGDSRLAMGAFVSGDFFDVLGVEPGLGRGFAADDRPETADAEPVAVLSRAAWQRRFGGDPGVLGRGVRINGRTVTVIGVAPRVFPGLTQGVSPELWLPSGLLSVLGPWGPEPPSETERRRARSQWVLGRLAPEATVTSVEAELTALAAALEREFPETNAERRFVVVPADRVRVLPGVDGRLYAAAMAMMGVVALVLLIASANLANLLLARAAGRRREMATRLALGASRAALIRQLLTESLLLSLLGGACGLCLAAGSNALLTSIELPIPVHLVLGLEIDATVFLFTFAVAALAALAFGLAPALEAARTDLTSGLRGEELGGGSPGRLRRALVVAQVAVSLVLLIGAGLALRSLQSAETLDPGFEPRGAVVATFAPRLQGYDRVRTEAFYERLTDAARSLPGVESAALASHLPLSLEIHFESVAAESRGGGPRAPEDEWPRVDSTKVGPGYFATLEIPLLRGRGFEDGDAASAPRVAVVNETLARRLWSDTAAVGRRLDVAGADAPYRVVGVAADGKYRTLGEAPQPHLFLALAQNRWRGGGRVGEISTGSETLVARVRGDAGAALTEIRRVAREIDESIAIARLITLEDALEPALWMPRMAAALLAAFGAVGLILAATGIYGLMAFTAHGRIPELGLRQALGARRRDLIALIVSDGLKLTAWGLAAGLAGAILASRGLSAWLYGVAATDPSTFLAVTVFLASIAGLASWLPARRAARVEPMEALRHD